MIRVFLDATVFFSAARDPDGMNRDIFDVAEKREDVVLLTNWIIVDEAYITLLFMALPAAPAELEALVEEYVNKCPVAAVESIQGILPLISDPDDAHVLAGALSAGAD